MGLRLEKLVLPTPAELAAMPAVDLLALSQGWRERLEVYQNMLFKARRQLYGSRSERSDGSSSEPMVPPAPAPRDETTKRPSERYPEAPVHVDEVNFPAPVACPACGETMQDSGMVEASEFLDVRPKEFIVVEQRRHKHRCAKCHGAIVTAPAGPRVTPGGSYSDELMVDATLSKFCNLIPMGRYSKIAERDGLAGLPPHSLIQASFQLATFLLCIYGLIRAEALTAAILLADETPHRMLEGDAKKRWFLWGFIGGRACFFECHDTRSGDVSTSVLKDSICEVLVTDVYSGYGKSVRVTNEVRAKEGRPPIQAAYCNSHARREFYSGQEIEMEHILEDARWVVMQYKEIYRLNGESKNLTDEGILAKRVGMRPYFEAIKAEAEKKKDMYSSKSQMGTAYNYFLNNYDGFTLCLTNPRVPLDNNASERLLRSHVVGRKTWYGTHSRRGAQAAAVHFTIVETCKLNGVNPREYYLDAIRRKHTKEELVTPSQYKAARANNTC